MASLDLPRTAAIPIIGGGAIGCSIAYHLGQRGIQDVVVFEAEVHSPGSTSKAAGGIRPSFVRYRTGRVTLEEPEHPLFTEVTETAGVR